MAQSILLKYADTGIVGKPICTWLLALSTYGLSCMLFCSFFLFILVQVSSISSSFVECSDFR
jgi:hypothetical protein